MTDSVLVVLAGGKGKRLGRDKLWLKLGGEYLLAREVALLASLNSEVILVLDEEKPLPPLPIPVKVVTDLYPGRGSLGGLYSGLRVCPAPYCLVLACDMPFLNPALLSYLLSLAPGHDVVVPRIGDLVEPLHAVYARTCLEPMHELLQQGDKRIIDFYPRVKVRYVEEAEVDSLDPERLSFFNINTPAELEKAQALLGK